MAKNFCPNCDNKPPEFETHYIYNVYIRTQRNSSTLRYVKVGHYCKKCREFFVFGQSMRKFILKETTQIN